MPIAGFGDGTMQHVFQRAMTVPGAGRMEIGEWTQGAGTTLTIPSTLTQVYWGYAFADVTKMGFPAMTDGNACVTSGGVDFCHSALTASNQVWQYMLFGD